MNDSSTSMRRFVNFWHSFYMTVTAAFAIFCLPSVAFSLTIGTVDQQNVGPNGFGGGASGAYSFGQSFTHTLPAIDAIEFRLGGMDAHVIVRLRDSVAGADGLGGNIIAESLPVVVNIPVGYARHHFDFPSRVPLTPGQQYVAELRLTSGGLGVFQSIDNRYPGGQVFNEGFPSALLQSQDLFFREGLHVPEPGGAAICFIAWALSHVRRRRD
jgi:hypothetical protein